jgi:predicted RNase H-like nuclease (RuvC/YqgF family)
MDLEKLKQDIEAYKQSEQEASEIIAELKAENDRLKYELYVTLKEKDRWNSNCNNFYDVCKKQYQTLQEIKKIVENNQFCFVAGAIVDYRDLNKLSKDMGKILDLITKAEEE